MKTTLGKEVMKSLSINNVRSAIMAIDTNRIRCNFNFLWWKVFNDYRKSLDFKLHHCPCIMSVWFLVTLITTYSISVGKKHAYAFFPYISDTGTFSPESCIFSQMVNIGSMMTIGSLGMSIVANFQKTNMRNVHFLGADMVLGGGVIYTIVQSKISYAFRELKIKPNSYGVNRRNIILRISISAASVLIFFIIVGCGYASEKDYEGDLIWWPPEAHGFAPHVVATVCEWLIILLISIFILSFTTELKFVEFIGIQFKLME